MYNLTLHNIKQIKAIVKEHGICWVHGDGNFFIKEEGTMFRREYCNPDQEDSKAWVKFVTGDRIPDTVEELEKLIQMNTARDNKDKKDKAKVQNKVTTIAVEVDDADEDDDDKVIKKDLDETQKNLLQRETFLNDRANQLKEHQDSLEQQKSTAEKLLTQKANTLQDQQEQLDAKAAELQEKEDRLLKLEASLKTKGGK